jgi:uroporphyrinogen-III synthase
VRVALLEARMSSELAELVRRYGGVVRSVPAVREAPLDCACIVADLVSRLQRPGRRVHLFLTGAGATALLQEAERQGQLPFVVESLKRGTIVARGPKPTAALKRYGLIPNLSASSPYTSNELLEAMAGLDLSDAEVTVVHYGERNDMLAETFRQRAAVLHELCVYEWRLPDDTRPLQDLARGLTTYAFDAVIFTSQVQWKHLHRVACNIGLGDAVVQALNSEVVVAAVGPICSTALVEAGVRPHVVPENPKMGPLVASLAGHFSVRPHDPHDPHAPYDPFVPQTGGG